MCFKYLQLILLICFHGVIHAQRGDQSCAAADLDGGFFVPQQARYPSGTVLPYACDEGRKPAEDTWWATITCTNGKWSSTPMCIDQKACFPPTIPNGKYTESSDGWYEERHILRIRCDPGYEQLNQIATASCLNGTWSSLPICEKSITSCSGPPQIPHAVVIQEYQEVFASVVLYQCDNGYFMEDGQNRKSISCTAGTWTEAPTCSKPDYMLPFSVQDRACVIPPGSYPQAAIQFWETFVIKAGPPIVQNCGRFDWIRTFTCTNSRSYVSQCKYNLRASQRPLHTPTHVQSQMLSVLFSLLLLVLLHISEGRVLFPWRYQPTLQMCSVRTNTMQ
uniref:Sushi domain-containing protein n=1 Tax=Echeneis naucrates TaxID=173247 RepID=A0A665T372_ECHNA